MYKKQIAHHRKPQRMDRAQLPRHRHNTREAAARSGRGAGDPTQYDESQPIRLPNKTEQRGYSPPISSGFPRTRPHRRSWDHRDEPGFHAAVRLRVPLLRSGERHQRGSRHGVDSLRAGPVLESPPRPVGAPGVPGIGSQWGRADADPGRPGHLGRAGSDRGARRACVSYPSTPHA